MDTTIKVSDVNDVLVKGDVTPLLFKKREYLRDMTCVAGTTSSQTTSNPSDYGPDDE